MQSSRRCSRQIVFCKNSISLVSGRKNDVDIVAATRLAATCAAFALVHHLTHFSRSSDNPISDAGAKILAEAVQSPHCQLRNLNIEGRRGNFPTIDSLSLFKGAFLTSPMLDTTTGTCLGDDGTVLLAKALESPNYKLTTFKLTGMMLSISWK